MRDGQSGQLLVSLALPAIGSRKAACQAVSGGGYDSLLMHLPQPQVEPPAHHTKTDSRTPIEDELKYTEHEGRHCARLVQQRYSDQAAADSNAVAYQRH